VFPRSAIFSTLRTTALGDTANSSVVAHNSLITCLLFNVIYIGVSICYVREILLHASEDRKLTSFTYEVCESKIVGLSLGQVWEKNGSCRADGSQRTKTFNKKGDVTALTSDVMYNPPLCPVQKILHLRHLWMYTFEIHNLKILQLISSYTTEGIAKKRTDYRHSFLFKYK